MELFNHSWLQKTTKLVFRLHLAALICLMTLDYIDPFGPMHGEEPTLTLRGRVSLVPQHWKVMNKGTEFFQTDSVGIDALVLNHESGFVRLDYTDMAKGLSGMNGLVLLTELASLWIWLYVSWAIWKLSIDLRTAVLFSSKNIRRLRIIAIIFPLGTLFAELHHMLFARLVRQVVTRNGYFIGTPEMRNGWNLFYNSNLFAAVMVMLVILLLTQVFIQGSKLQEEQSLTV